MSELKFNGGSGFYSMQTSDGLIVSLELQSAPTRHYAISVYRDGLDRLDGVVDRDDRYAFNLKDAKARAAQLVAAVRAGGAND
jgi:hypothetical protein